MKNRFKVETRGNSFVVYDTQKCKCVEWFNSNRLAPEQRKAAEALAKKLNDETP
jgi:hypothetical protein